MLTLVIEAGGESRRMGRDKALLPFMGRPLIERILSRVGSIADEVLVVANRPERYAFLGCRVIPDARPGRGALGGLHTAFAAAAHECVAVAGCDMPFVSAPLLRFQRDVLLGEPVDAAVPETEGGLEPFHAVYRRSACLPAVEAALDAGLWRATEWLGRVCARRISAEEVARYDPRGAAFLNLNTPEEYARAEALARAWEE
jgi:molybdopterin-guanine dinucleotide biosynthesis protein A